MGVYIKGMAMPQNCYECRFCKTYTGHHLCVAFLNYIADPRSGRLETCPLIPVPDHGDLIDRDALFDDNSWDWFNEWGSTVNKQAELVADAPVVIPAERSEDGET